MKQGRAPTTQSGHKTDPSPRAVNPQATSEIGVQQVRTQSQKLFEGRGFKAPAMANHSHPRGSQGKH